MNKILKAGILLITLAIPAFVFIFLHGFGDNKFEVPLYYEEGVDTAFVSCTLEVPHRVLKSNLKDKITVVSFNKEQLNELNRLCVDYESYAEFQSILFYDSSKQQLGNRSARLKNDQLKFSAVGDFSALLSCLFIIDESELKEFPLVMVDQDQRIRGYYYTSDTEEFERLIHELNIILENSK